MSHIVISIIEAFAEQRKSRKWAPKISLICRQEPFCKDKLRGFFITVDENGNLARVDELCTAAVQKTSEICASESSNEIRRHEVRFSKGENEVSVRHDFLVFVKHQFRIILY